MTVGIIKGDTQAKKLSSSTILFKEQHMCIIFALGEYVCVILAKTPSFNI